MNPIETTNEKLNASGGLGLVGKLIERNCDFGKRITEADEASRSDRISDGDILKAEVGLLAQGRSHFADIELFGQANDEGFAANLGLDTIPSEACLRQRLQELAVPDTFDQLEADSLNIINGHSISGIELGGTTYLPLDIDVSPFDNSGSNRENVGRTYKGYDGYAPIFSYLGVEGWIIHHEQRPGTQHCQKNTPEFIAETLDRIDSLQLSTPVLARLDAGNDSEDTLKVLRESGIDFIIKRNLRREETNKWLSHAMALGLPEIQREGKEVYTGTVEHLCPGGEKSKQDPLTVVYQVTQRTIDKHGNPLLLPDVEIETYWVSTWNSPEEVIACYHEHGTSEQFHSELKTDLKLERSPSNSYSTNVLFLSMGVLTYNLLRAIEQRAGDLRDLWPPHLKRQAKNLKRRRVGSVIRDLICVAGKWVKHAGKSLTKISKSWPWAEVIIRIDAQLST